MKRSSRALLGMVVLDVLLLAGVAWLVWLVHSGAVRTTVPAGEAITTITSIGGGVVGAITGLLLFVFVYHRRRGN